MISIKWVVIEIKLKIQLKCLIKSNELVDSMLYCYVKHGTIQKCYVKHGTSVKTLSNKHGVCCLEVLALTLFKTLRV